MEQSEKLERLEKRIENAKKKVKEQQRISQTSSVEEAIELFKNSSILAMSRIDRPDLGSYVVCSLEALLSISSDLDNFKKFLLSRDVKLLEKVNELSEFNSSLDLNLNNSEHDDVISVLNNRVYPLLDNINKIESELGKLINKQETQTKLRTSVGSSGIIDKASLIDNDEDLIDYFNKLINQLNNNIEEKNKTIENLRDDIRKLSEAYNEMQSNLLKSIEEKDQTIKELVDKNKDIEVLCENFNNIGAVRENIDSETINKLAGLYDILTENVKQFANDLAFKERGKTIKEGERHPGFKTEINNKELEELYIKNNYKITRQMVEYFNSIKPITYQGLMLRLKKMNIWKGRE